MLEWHKYNEEINNPELQQQQKRSLKCVCALSIANKNKCETKQTGKNGAAAIHKTKLQDMGEWLEKEERKMKTETPPTMMELCEQIRK